MKIAIITSVYYPDYSVSKYDLIRKVLGIIPDYAGIDYDLFLLNDGVEDDRFHEFMKGYKPRGFCKSINYTARENKGITKSLNELLSKVDSSYDFICLLDLDVFVPVYWLKKCVSVLSEFELVGICGSLVQDKLSFDLNTGISKTKDSVLFSHVESIGGACMVFRAKEVKDYGWDEELVSDHIDAYMITRYRNDGKSTYAILERGYHPREVYESERFRNMKLDRFEKELPKFYKVVNKLKKGRT
jgi:hypothetical protein